MRLNLHNCRRTRIFALLATTAALAALVAATAGQVASAAGGEPPCPSCPYQYPPPSGSGGSGSGGSGGASSGQAAQPLISLGPVVVANGVASITGVVNANVGVDVNVNLNPVVQVTVNAQPVSIAIGGQFSASVNVKATAAIRVQALDRSNGETNSITIPVSAIPAGGTPSDALAQLDADVVTMMVPTGGFTTVDGVAIDATVHVGSIDGIARLRLNGADLLAHLRISASSKSGSNAGKPTKPTKPSVNPGSPAPSTGPTAPPCRHSASRSVSGSAKTVKLTVTATNGASQTSTFVVKRVQSVIRVGRLLSISAFGARGIRITRIQFTTNMLAHHRLGVTVTVRDRRNYLIRDAVIMLKPAANRTSLHSTWVQMSNLLGRATFTVPITAKTLNHRLYLNVLARTPRANTQLAASVLLTGAAR